MKDEGTEKKRARKSERQSTVIKSVMKDGKSWSTLFIHHHTHCWSV